MKSNNSSKNDENKVEQFLLGRGLNPKRFSKNERKDKNNPGQFIKTPDFKVFDSESFAFFGEVKSIDEKDQSESLEHTRVFSVLSNDINTAFKQFVAVNKSHDHPNVLFWISHSMRLNSHQFQEFIKGSLELPDGKVHLDMKHLESFERIRVKKNIFDLFVWLHGEKPIYFLNATKAEHIKKVSNLFDLYALPF